MGLLKSITSILKNVGKAAGITAAAAGRKAIERARTEYNVRTKSSAKNVSSKPTPPREPRTNNVVKQVAKVTTPQPQKSTPPKVNKVETPQQVANKGVEAAKSAVNKEPPAGHRYFSDTERLLLNQAGLTRTVNGEIARSAAYEIALNVGLTPEQALEFAQERPELADDEYHDIEPEVRAFLDKTADLHETEFGFVDSKGRPVNNIWLPAGSVATPFVQEAEPPTSGWTKV